MTNELRTIEQRVFGTEWRDVAIQIQRRGQFFRLCLTRVFESGDQETVEIPISAAYARDLRTFWDKT